ncbi:MAG: VOC family protein [Candidatus Binatia bacterium]|nr:VOC family protein [Candidatus Binatia bacterium]
MAWQLSHIGLCVADLERARRFYCEGLGFREVSTLEVRDEPAATLLQIPNVELQAVYLERDGFRLELLYYRHPGAIVGTTPHQMNACGLTHLSFQADDITELEQRLLALGGQPLPETRVELDGIGLVALFVLDPDGTRIELVRRLNG